MVQGSERAAGELLGFSKVWYKALRGQILRLKAVLLVSYKGLKATSKISPSTLLVPKFLWVHFGGPRRRISIEVFLCVLSITILPLKNENEV